MSKLEYDGRVRHWIPASVALSALLLAFPFVCKSQAQFSSSAASPTGAVRPFTGAVQPMTGSVQPPTSVIPGRTGVGFGGHIAGSSVPAASKAGTDKDHRRRHRDQYGGYYVPYAVAIPYAPDDEGPADVEPENDAEDQGGPTVF